jgi:hypothetical protein
MLAKALKTIVAETQAAEISTLRETNRLLVEALRQVQKGLSEDPDAFKGTIRAIGEIIKKAEGGTHD